jgi:hypothetical protein
MTDAARWRGYTHEELYTLLHQGSGAAASAAPSRRWAELSATLSDVGQDLNHALSRVGWSGPAASAAQERLAVLADWANENGASAAAMRESVETQGDHIARARADMPAPADTPTAQPDPTAAPAMQLVAVQTDHEPAEAASASGEQRAFEVMAAYERDTNTNTGALATFQRPGELNLSSELRSNRGDGIPAITTAATAGPDVVPPGLAEQQDHGRRPHGELGRGGHAPVGAVTSGAAAIVDPDIVRRPAPPPSSFTVAAPVGEPVTALGPFGGAYRGGGGGSGRSGGGGRGLPIGSSAPVGTGSPVGSGGAIGAGSSIGAGGAAGLPPGLRVDDLPAAAAGQAAASQAAAAHPGAVPPGTAGTAGSAQERVAMRRMGMDSIGSSHWFGDDEDAAPRQNQPRRRRDFRESEKVTESVSLMGEERQVPPTVIGD